MSDSPLDDARRDYFGFRVYANALAEVIDNEATRTPLTIAVSAPWGAGKTSVARMIEGYLREWTQRLEGERRILCWFPAWKHGDADHLGAALAAAVAVEANQHRPFWRRIVQPLPSSMLSSRGRWRRGVKIGLTALAITAIALAVPAFRDAVKSLGLFDEAPAAGVGSLGAAVISTVILAAFLWRQLFSAAEGAARFIDNPASEAARGSMDEVGKQLKGLIKQATRGGRLVVFVDDLERCAPAHAVEVCEVASQLLSFDGVVTVFIADMQAIAMVAEKSYLEAGGGEAIGRRYLEKIVQIQLAIPPPSTQHMKRLLRGEDPEGYVADGEAEDISPQDSNVQPAFLPARSLAKVIEEPLIAIPTIILSLLVGLFLGLNFFVTEPPGEVLNRPLGVLWAASASDIIISLVYATPFAVWAWAFVYTALTAYRRSRARSKRREINTLIQQEISTGTQLDKLEDVVMEKRGGKDRDFVVKLVRGHLLDYSDEIERVDQVILNYPPPLPRGAKRMLNHARLLTQIARDRKIFEGESALTPEHLGEWIVIQERWLPLAQMVAAEPNLLQRLEEVACRDEFEDVIKEIGVTLQDVDALAHLLCTGPKLGDVVTPLIHFQPALRDSREDDLSGDTPDDALRKSAISGSTGTPAPGVQG